MEAITAAIECGIDLNALQVNLTFITGGAWVFLGDDLDQADSPAPTCPQCGQRADGVPDVHIDGMAREYVSLLDVAILLGQPDVAKHLVESGISECCMLGQDLRSQLVWCTCSNAGCGAEVIAPLFAGEARRVAAALAARTSTIARMREEQLNQLVALHPWTRQLHTRLPGHCAVTILGFAIDWPCVLLRLGHEQQGEELSHMSSRYICTVWQRLQGTR